LFLIYRVVKWCADMLDTDRATNKRLGDFGADRILNTAQSGNYLSVSFVDPKQKFESEFMIQIIYHASIMYHHFIH